MPPDEQNGANAAVEPAKPKEEKPSPRDRIAKLRTSLDLSSDSDRKLAALIDAMLDQ
jgi:hypothetical protein